MRVLPHPVGPLIHMTRLVQSVIQRSASRRTSSFMALWYLQNSSGAMSMNLLIEPLL